MEKVSAGSYDLNRWLHGGYDRDVITTLYGGPGSGKTNFCLVAAVSHARKGKKVIFIDTEGGFSSERVKQLLFGGNGNGNAQHECEMVLKNILILKPTNFAEQKRSFDELLKHVRKEIHLIIVDGMTMLYRLDFADAREQDLDKMQRVNAELTRQMRMLAEISRKQNIPIIITNQVYNWEKAQRMVGGDILKYWSKCLIELTNEHGKRAAILRKHRSLPEKKLSFSIVDEGIKKRGWI